MITLSLCMIVKNEEDNLPRALESIKDVVDEIIIVDTGSTDNTVAIVKDFTNKIYKFKWIDDFSAARNYSFSKATMDYIMWLDADDIIKKKDLDLLKSLKRELNKDVDIVMAKYDNMSLSYYRARIFKRENNYIWEDKIHEYIKPEGNIINSDISITHKAKGNKTSNRNIDIFEKMIDNKEEFSARNVFYYARELYYNKRYKEAVERFNEFLDKEDGWEEDKISACYDLSLCYNNLSMEKQALRVLLRSLEYGLPRAEHSSQIGDYYLNKYKYKEAIFWYKLAISLEEPVEAWGFTLKDYWYYYPSIQLCICYYKLGDVETSIYYNDKASTYKPYDDSVLYNKQYFERYNK